MQKISECQNFTTIVCPRNVCPRRCLELIDELIEKNPDAKYIAIPLVSYRIMRWAVAANEKITAEIEEFADAMNNNNTPFQRREACIEKTAELVRLIDKGLDSLACVPNSSGKLSRILSAIHTDKDVTQRKRNGKIYGKIDTVYREALEKLFSLNSIIGEAKEIFRELENEIPETEMENIFYHQTQVFFSEIYSNAIWHKENDTSGYHGGEYPLQKAAIDLVDKILEEIQEFPYGDGEIYRSVIDVSYGPSSIKSQNQKNSDKAKTIGCSMDTFRKLRSESIEIVSAALWGLSSQRIFNLLHE